MDFIFASTACSKETYSKIFLMRNKKLIDPTQKFLEQLMAGVAHNDSVNVISISARPVSASTTKKRNFQFFSEKENDIKYIYPAFINGKILRFLTNFFSTFINTVKVLKNVNNKKAILICDPLSVEISRAARLAGGLFGIKSIAIVTDIPNYATGMKQHEYGKLRYRLQHIYEDMCFEETKKYDGYILLTDSMNEIVNKRKKVSIVIEGSVDYKLKEEKELAKREPKIVLYAGGIYEKYGVKNLVEAFQSCNMSGYELHLYGEGTYVDELKEICRANPNIKYKGCVLNTKLVEIESKATLLVNPRFSDEEYTKYSFPSKTLEYMSSGTPVLSTRLSGIPKEYEDYIFYFDGEDVGQMSSILETILSMSSKKLNEKGKRAQTFVFDRKSNIEQGKRIILLGEKISKLR